MKITEIQKIISDAVDHECLLPDLVREIIQTKLNKSQKEKFKEIVIAEMTRSIKEELSAEYDIFRGWE